MWVCVLLSSYEGSTSVLNGLDPPCDPTQWMTHLPDYQFEQHFIRKATALPQIRALVQSKRFDVFINLCDGAWDEDRAGVEVVKALEMFKVPFTGASSEFYDCSKETMKMVANYEGVKTPAFIFAYDEADVEQAITDLPFKVVVKHFNGYSSVGMTRKSLCGTPEELRVEAARTIGEFGGALIEEFIEGREATVLVAENPADPAHPIALLPVECCFPVGETFKHFDLKWNDYGGLQWKPMEEPELVKKLKETAVRMFVGLKGVSYGRCDFRICAKTGVLNFLEINPNCGIFYPADAPGSADCILALDPMRHSGFIQLIIDAALQRNKRLLEAAPKWAKRYLPKHGYSLVATVPIKAGELIMTLEERPQFLVSRAHADQEWSGQKRKWFSTYAWPLSNEVYVMWSDRVEDWRPLNHSCDPNAWFAEGGGLDVVARRDIAAREQVTMDYATYCGENMTSFDCICGSPGCRRIIRGTDYKDPLIRQRYGTHMSHYVLAHGKKIGANGFHRPSDVTPVTI